MKAEEEKLPNSNDTANNKLVVRKNLLPEVRKENTALATIPVVSFEKIDQTYYAFSYKIDDCIDLKMEESDQKTDSTEYIEADFDATVQESDKVFYALAAASGVLTSALTMAHLNEEQLKKLEEINEKDWKPIIVSAANFIGYKKNDYKGACDFLVKRAVKTITENDKTKEVFIELSQHPSIASLIFSMIIQFSGKSYYLSNNGKLSSKAVPEYYYIGKTDSEKIFCGFLYWLFILAANEATSKRHIIDELGISKELIKKIKEFANLPFMKAIPTNYEEAERKFSLWLKATISDAELTDEDNEEDNNRNVWVNIFRVALNFAEDSFLVLVNEGIVRGLYLLSRICNLVKTNKITSFEGLSEIPVLDLLPANNRIMSRMCLIASASFVATNIACATLKGIKDHKAGNREFAEAFLAELNIAGIGRFLFACAADSKYWGKDITVLFQRKDKTSNENQTIEDDDAFSSLLLDAVQTRILYSLESVSVEYDIKSTKKESLKNLKRDWLNDWKASTLRCAEVADEYSEQYFVENEDILYEGIFQLARDKSNWKWFYLLTQELALFKPYYALGTTNDKSYKKLKTEYDYISDQFIRRQTIAIQSEMDSIITAYSKYKGFISGSTKKAVLGVTVTAAVAAASGGLALSFAPGIAAAIAGDAVAGLSGAALSSASLAFVGGGSIAAGGLGVAGGTAMITGGGALLGLAGTGTASAAAIILQTPSEYWVRQAAKLLTFCDCILKEKLDDTKSIVAIQRQVSYAIKVNEDKLSSMKEENNDLNKDFISKSVEYIKYLRRCESKLQGLLKE